VIERKVNATDLSLYCSRSPNRVSTNPLPPEIKFLLWTASPMRFRRREAFSCLGRRDRYDRWL